MKTIDMLSQLVAINSSYPHEEKIGKYIKEVLRENDFKVTIQKVEKGRSNILGEIGKGPAFLIFGHLDTVQETVGWTTNPFNLIKKGDRLYGLGAWDMKGGIAALLSSIKNFNFKNNSLKVAFVVDEEFVSAGMCELIKSGWLSDVFGAVAVEPGFNYGIKGIALGRIGRSVYKVEVKTTGGHVYLVEKRSNAITESYKVLSILKNIKSIPHVDLGKSVIFPRYIKGGANSMAVPGYVEMEIETQLVLPQTTESVLKEMKTLINTARKRKQLDAEVIISLVSRPTPFCQPYVMDKNNGFVQKVSKILLKAVGDKIKYYYRRSVGDENRIAELGIPVLTIGPDGGNAHQPDEWVSEKSLYVLEDFLKNLLSSNFSF